MQASILTFSLISALCLYLVESEVVIGIQVMDSLRKSIWDVVRLPDRKELVFCIILLSFETSGHVG